MAESPSESVGHEHVFRCQDCDAIGQAIPPDPILTVTAAEGDAGFRALRAALMFLVSRAREDLDGGRPLTEAERELLRDVAYWWESHPWHVAVRGHYPRDEKRDNEGS